MVIADAGRRITILITIGLALSVFGCSPTGSNDLDQPEINQESGSVEIINEAALALIDPAARFSIRADGFKWTEGPLWIEEGGYLLFSDIPNNVIMRYDPGVGSRLYLERSGATGLDAGDSSQGSNGLLLDASGKLVLLQQGDRRVARMDVPLQAPEAKFTTLAGEYDGRRLNSPNDGVFHSNGSLYFTDPPYGLDQGMDDPHKTLSFQGIYRLRSNGVLELLDDSVSFPNGIALSADEKTLLVAVSDESWPVWLAYDLQADGSTGERRIFFDSRDSSDGEPEPGMPDGMAVHSSGTIFATGPGGVWVFSPQGVLLARLYTGRLTANCSLSADEKTLFLTAHNTLMTFPLK